MGDSRLEREFLQWLRQHAVADPQTVIGIGDDAAVFSPGNNPLLVTTDTIAEGTHFLLPGATCEQVGWKALAVSLSDIAAMGGTPRWALVNFLLPQSWSAAQAQQLYGGVSQCAARYGVTVIGGDTNRWSGKLVITTTVVGTALTDNHWPLSGARAGDVVAVSGKLGGSLLGNHLNFEPRCELARYLAKHYRINAATDISDSFTVDLALLCEASGCGVVVDLAKIPLTQATTERSQQTGRAALEHALYDGEDFELLLAVPPDQWQNMQRDDLLMIELTAVGTFVPEKQRWTVDHQGVKQPMIIQGYEH